MDPHRIPDRRYASTKLRKGVRSYLQQIALPERSLAQWPAGEGWRDTGGHYRALLAEFGRRAVRDEIQRQRA